MTNSVPIFKNLSLENLPGEEWKDIEEFEGYYQVSNLGRVKSLRREVWVEEGKFGGYYLPIPERILRIQIQKKRGGEAIVHFNKDAQKSSHRVSRLVAYAFIPVTNKMEIVFHKNLDRLDNSVNNLYWADVSDYSDMVKKKSNRFKKDGKFSIYKGVTRWFIMNIEDKEKGVKIRKTFQDEIEAAKKYDFYIDKFNLNRRKNFESNL